MKSYSYDSVKAAVVTARVFEPEEVEDLDFLKSGSQALNGFLPKKNDLSELLGIDDNATIEDILQVALLNPLKELTFNRGKRVRAFVAVAASNPAASRPQRGASQSARATSASSWGREPAQPGRRRTLSPPAPRTAPACGA